jgi:hypothetical protein
MPATRHPMDFDPIRLFHRLQGVSGMAWLSAASPLVPMALTLGRRFPVPIAGRRLAAVTTVLRQLVFEELNPFFQKSHALNHLLDKGDYRIFTLPIDAPDLVFCRLLDLVHPPYFLSFFG